MLPQREQSALSTDLSLQTQNESTWTCYDIFATHKPGLLSILSLTTLCLKTRIMSPTYEANGISAPKAHLARRFIVMRLGAMALHRQTTGGRRLFQVDCSCRSLLLRGEPLSGLGGTRPRRYRHAGLQRFYSWRSAWRFQFANSGFVPRCIKDSAATTVVYRSGSRIPAVSRRDTDSQRGRPDTCAVRLNIFRRAQTVAAIGATT
jgi:hypothetical protein